MHPQPLIAVADVEASRRWYRAVLGLESGHGGDDYEQLLAEGRMVLQLHRWDAHEHRHMGSPDAPARGNGMLLWFQDDAVDAAWARAGAHGAEVLEPLRENPNAHHREFWLRDPDGYVVVVAGAYGDLG